MDKALYLDRYNQIDDYITQLLIRMGWTKPSDIPRELKAIRNITFDVSEWDVGLFYNDLIFENYELRTIFEWQHDIIKWQMAWLRGAGIDNSLSDPPALNKIENEYYAYMKYHSAKAKQNDEFEGVNMRKLYEILHKQFGERKG